MNAKYWLTDIELESLLLIFIKSLRLAGFSLFVTYLKEMIIWMCSLDHTQYARLMSVFIKDFLKFPSMYQNNFFLKVISQRKRAKKITLTLE